MNVRYQTKDVPSLSRLTEQMVQVCTNLRPFQSLEYDPATNVVSIITENLVPCDAIEQIVEILANRRNDEKISIRRFADTFKVTLIRQIKL